MKSNNLTIIFFCPKILRDSHREIFQLERLKKEGYDFILLDATKHYGSEATATDEIILQNKIECTNEQDFVQFRQTLPANPVLFIIFDLFMTLSAPVLNILVRKRDKVLSYQTKRFTPNHIPSGSLRKFLGQALPKVEKIIPIHNLKFYYRWRYGMYVPDYYLCSTEFLIPLKTYFTVKKDRRIVVHSDDMNNLFNKKKSIIDPEKKIGVFLDQGIPFINRTHPNLYKKPLPANYLTNYYQKLENTLSSLKQDLELDEIIIALHPDAVKFKKELKDKFISFRTFIGVTKDLIKDSSIVFGHSSTAFSYAIFYKKPLLILKDDFLMTYHQDLRNSILYFEEELNMTSINFDKQYDVFPEVKLDLGKYEDYVRKYLKDNKIQENSYFFAIQKIESDLQKFA